MGFDTEILKMILKATPKGVTSRNYNIFVKAVKQAKRTGDAYNAALAQGIDDTILYNLAKKYRDKAIEIGTRLPSSVTNPILSKIGSVMNPLLNILTSAETGWGMGRFLGHQPLMTNPNTTYDKFYTELFKTVLLDNKKELGNKEE